VTQFITWIWCIIFSMSVGSITVFVITAVAHALLIAGVDVSIASFTVAQYRHNSFVQLARRLCANHIQAKIPGKSW
jgi:hypothetical protein